MASSEAQLLLEQAILDYMAKRGLHQSGDVFSCEIHASQNNVANNSPREAFLQAWWGKFYEEYRIRFPDGAVLAIESFDKVAHTLESVVANSGSVNQPYASDHTEANISNVMPVVPSSSVMDISGPDPMDARISNLLSSFDTEYALLDLSSPRDMNSGLQVPEMGEMDSTLPFASDSGYQMQQMSTVPHQMQQMSTVPQAWNARDDRPSINLVGSMLMEPNFHAPSNALPASTELSNAGHNISLQQASHQGWPAVMFRDTNQRTPENLPADQQIIAPVGGIMRRYGKQPAVQEQINQPELLFSNKSGRKRKTPSNSLEFVRKDKSTVASIAMGNTTSYLSQRHVGLVSASNSIYALTENFSAPELTPTKGKGDSLIEISNLHIVESKLLCCHINSRGDLLATGGDDGKVLIWELKTNNVVGGEGHSDHVTDVRFRPNSTVFATSSSDKTVKIWDATKPSNSFQTLVGHGGHVMSIDFHPKKVDLLCSCYSNDEIRLWDVNTGDCKLYFKGGSRQVRFQPGLGDLLATSTGNVINIFDIETNNIRIKLQGHVKDVLSICWDPSGNFLASVSEDCARIWSVSDRKCIHELYSSGNKFQSCTFHPADTLVLLIGSDKFLELWNPTFQSNITRTHSAHSGIISSLADSHSEGIVASVSHDQWIKIWK